MSINRLIVMQRIERYFYTRWQNTLQPKDYERFFDWSLKVAKEELRVAQQKWKSEWDMVHYAKRAKIDLDSEAEQFIDEDN